MTDSVRTWDEVALGGDEGVVAARECRHVDLSLEVYGIAGLSYVEFAAQYECHVTQERPWKPLNKNKMHIRRLRFRIDVHGT